MKESAVFNAALRARAQWKG